MASLSLTIGNQSVSLSMPDAKATALINDIVEATGGPMDGTAKQKAAWLLRQITQELRIAQRRAIHARKEAQVRTELDTELDATGDWVEA